MKKCDAAAWSWPPYRLFRDGDAASSVTPRRLADALRKGNMKKALKAFNALRAEYLNLPERHWTERDPISIIGVSNNLLEKLQEFAIRDYRHAIPRKTWDKFFKMIVDDLTRYSTRDY